MVERQSPLETNIHKLEDLVREREVNMTLAFSPKVSPQKRQQAKEVLPEIEEDMRKVFRQTQRAFKGDKPSTAVQPPARFPKSSKPKRSSTLKRQVVMDTEELSGGRKRRKTRRHRRNNVKKSNK